MEKQALELIDSDDEVYDTDYKLWVSGEANKQEIIDLVAKIKAKFPDSITKYSYSDGDVMLWECLNLWQE
jgi:hypothetical protein